VEPVVRGIFQFEAWRGLWHSRHSCFKVQEGLGELATKTSSAPGIGVGVKRCSEREAKEHNTQPAVSAVLNEKGAVLIDRQADEQGDR
jgi:hypothetical protein